MLATTRIDVLNRNRPRHIHALLAFCLALTIRLPAHADEGSQPAVAPAPLASSDSFDPFDPPASNLEVITSDPFATQPAVYDPFEDPGFAPSSLSPLTTFVEQPSQRSAAALFDKTARRLPVATLAPPVANSAPADSLHRLISHQTEPAPLIQEAIEEALPDPCFVGAEKRPTELTIDIAMQSGEFPKDFAASCFQQRSAQAGPYVATRDWPTFNYQWNATSFCHQPLYFEEINLERYGYGCSPCLQPAVSAAHFFATVPALPYCLAATCPTECIYTLGYYRPGSCPPRQINYPPCIGVK